MECGQISYCQILRARCLWSILILPLGNKFTNNFEGQGPRLLWQTPWTLYILYCHLNTNLTFDETNRDSERAWGAYRQAKIRSLHLFQRGPLNKTRRRRDKPSCVSSKVRIKWVKLLPKYSKLRSLRLQMPCRPYADNSDEVIDLDGDEPQVASSEAGKSIV